MRRKFLLQLFADAGQGSAPEPASATGDEPGAVNPQAGAGVQDGAPQDGGDQDGSQAEPVDPEALRKEVDKLRKELERARREAAKYRTERKTWQEKVAEALGLKPAADDLNPERLSTELAQLRQKYREERLRNTFLRLADKLGADVELTFAVLRAAGDLDDLDPDDDDFEELLKARVETALANNPKLRREPPIAQMQRTGAEFGGGNGAELLTLEQIRRMTPEEINRNWERVRQSLQALGK